MFALVLYSRLYQNLVIKEKICNKIDTFLGEDLEPSLFYIKAFLNEGVDYLLAEKKIKKELDLLCAKFVSDSELNAALKKNESTILFSYIDNSYKAIDLAVGELLGDIDFINKQIPIYNSIKASQIMRDSINMFDPKNCTSLYYGK